MIHSNRVRLGLGEFMQLSTKESDAEQFQDYLNKTFCKTASLFANTCKAVSNYEDDRAIRD